MASTFIRATEVWVPTADGSSIDLAAGIYGREIGQFQAVSRGMRLAYGEGLPGKTWERGQPIILKNLASLYFNRGDVARADGLACAVSLPLFASGVLKAVLLLVCNELRLGAIELWCAPEGEDEMTLIDGYFGTAASFETVTREAAYPRGIGLAGHVWESGRPLLMPELAQAGPFARTEAAQRVGFHRGVGWPCAVRGSGDWVMAFLSARQSPIASRFESWLPEPDGRFRFDSGFCESDEDLAARWTEPQANPAFDEARRSLIPVVMSDMPDGLGAVGASAAAAGLTSGVVLPILAGGRLRALLTWYF